MTFPVFWRNCQHVAGRCVPLKTRVVRRDRSNPTGGLDGGRPQREWQPHVEDLALSWKCKVRKVSIQLWWEISNGFWGFALPFMCPPPSLSLHLFSDSGFGLKFPSTARLSRRMRLWTRAARRRGRVIKRPFMQARSLWWGCHFVQYLTQTLRNFRLAWPRPHAAEDWLTDRPVC